MKYSLSVAQAKSLGFDIPEGHVAGDIELPANEIIAKALSANHDLTAAAVTATERDEANTKALAVQIEAHAALDPDAEIVRHLSVDPKSRGFKRSQSMVASAIDAEVSLALSKGKIDKRGEAVLRTLLSVEASYSLSAEGVAAPTDVAEAVKTLLGLIPEGSAVPTKAMEISAVEGEPTDAGKKATVDNMSKGANA